MTTREIAKNVIDSLPEDASMDDIMRALYGQSREEAVAKTKALALRVLADRLEHGEQIPELGGIFAVPA